ncbi:MAG: SDR family oxidoreductase [Firmicutes bacterium]|nr:SDR family oxidoreductase [Bacillota bacterium]
MSAEGGRVVIVTGASRGIGRAIAVELSRAGESVVAVARTARDLEETLRFMEEVRPAGSAARHSIHIADVTRESEVEALFRGAAERYGRVDVLVNNAGHVDPVGILEMTLENWTHTLATNLTAAFLCTREFVRANKRVGGKIINIASTAGLTPRPGWSAYAAAKAGLINFSLTMSEELKPYGIKVYCVAPGRTATELRQKLAPEEDPATILQPAAVGRLVRLLVSPEGDYIDQQTIVIRKPLP